MTAGMAHVSGGIMAAYVLIAKVDVIHLLTAVIMTAPGAIMIAKMVVPETDQPATGGDVEVVVPKTGVVAGVYVQAISAYAPHPNAAKLWMEHLYSDEGQLIWLEGGCHPIRFNDLVAKGKVPQELLDALPPAEAYEKAVFPTLDEQNAANAAITGKWDQVVGANVQ